MRKDNTGLCSTQGRRQWCPAPHVKSVPPHFTFGPPVAEYINTVFLKCAPPFWFLAPLINPGDGPGSTAIGFDIFRRTRNRCSTIVAKWLLPKPAKWCHETLLDPAKKLAIFEVFKIDL